MQPGCKGSRCDVSSWCGQVHICSKPAPGHKLAVCQAARAPAGPQAWHTKQAHFGRRRASGRHKQLRRCVCARGLPMFPALPDTGMPLLAAGGLCAGAAAAVGSRVAKVALLAPLAASPVLPLKFALAHPIDARSGTVLALCAMAAVVRFNPCVVLRHVMPRCVMLQLHIISHRCGKKMRS